MTAKCILARVVALGVAGLVSVLIAACTTPYQPMGLLGGVDDLQLNDTMYRITARGNGNTSSERVHDFVLLRASEIAISRGYRGFVIGSTTDQSRTYQFTLPGEATSHTFVSGGMNGMPAIATTYTTVSPPITNTVFKPGTAVEVTLVQEGGMDARMINASLAPKYGVEPMVQPIALETSPNEPSPSGAAAANEGRPVQLPACTKEDEKRAYLARVTGHTYQQTCN